MIITLGEWTQEPPVSDDSLPKPVLPHKHVDPCMEMEVPALHAPPCTGLIPEPPQPFATIAPGRDNAYFIGETSEVLPLEMVQGR